MFTFLYILRPRFNIVSVYLAVGLAYYLLLNVVPMDYFIAKSQIAKYTNGERDDLAYAFSLSPDAAQPLFDLLQERDDPALCEAASIYFSKFADLDQTPPQRWQRFNLSQEKYLKLAEKANEMLS